MFKKLCYRSLDSGLFLYLSLILIPMKRVKNKAKIINIDSATGKK